MTRFHPHLFACLLFACAEPSSSGLGPDEPELPRPAGEPTPNPGVDGAPEEVARDPAREELLRRVEEILVQAPDCDVGCPTFTARPDPSVTPNPDGNNVLLVDLGVYWSPLTIYRHRVIAHYGVEPAGFTSTEVVLSEAQERIYALVREHPSLVFDPRLSALMLQYKNKGKDMPSVRGFTGHGDFQFNFIAETSPNTRFVIFHLGEAEDRLDLCHLFELDQAAIAERVRAVYRSKGAELREIVERHQIGFINYSLGIDVDSFLEMIWRPARCRGPAPSREKVVQFMDAAKVFHEELERSGALLVQSAPYPSSPITTENEDDYLLDCLELGHRLLVSYTLARDASIPPEGSTDPDRVDEPVARNAMACTDIYIGNDTDGYSEAGPWAPRVTQGLFHYHDPFFATSTSFNAAVALSHLLYLEYGIGDHARVETILHDTRGKSSFLILDPFRNRQFITPDPMLGQEG